MDVDEVGEVGFYPFQKSVYMNEVEQPSSAGAEIGALEYIWGTVQSIYSSAEHTSCTKMANIF